MLLTSRPKTLPRDDNRFFTKENNLMHQLQTSWGHQNIQLQWAYLILEPHLIYDLFRECPQ